MAALLRRALRVALDAPEGVSPPALAGLCAELAEALPAAASPLPATPDDATADGPSTTAREMEDAARREAVLLTHDLLRSQLVAPPSPVLEGVQQVRDDLLVAARLVDGTLDRIAAAVAHIAAALPEGAGAPPPGAAPPPRSALRGAPGARGGADATAAPVAAPLRPGELQLLADSVFLATYTVQTSAEDALRIRAELTTISGVVDAAAAAAAASAGRMVRWGGAAAVADAAAADARDRAVLVELVATRNVLFLSWCCALDRTRYGDVYNPVAGTTGVNALLKDADFCSRVCGLGVGGGEEEEEEDVARWAGVRDADAAAELVAAVFLLATADPDEDAAVMVGARVCLYGGALSWLSGELADWLDAGLGGTAVTTDGELYADALEDLVLDVCESPRLSDTLLSLGVRVAADAAAVAAAAAAAEEADLADTVVALEVRWSDGSTVVRRDVPVDAVYTVTAA